MTTFTAIWLFVVALCVASIGLGLSAITHFKRVAPDEYERAGSPSIWFSTSADSALLSYLIRGHHKRLKDPILIRKLSILKLVWLTFLASFICALVILARSIGA